MNPHQELIQRCLASGLAKPPAPKVRAARPRLTKEELHARRAARYRAERDGNYARGLRSDGKPKVNRRFPQLHGLTGRDYNRAYWKLYKQQSQPAGRTANSKH